MFTDYGQFPCGSFEYSRSHWSKRERSSAVQSYDWSCALCQCRADCYPYCSALVEFCFVYFHFNDIFDYIKCIFGNRVLVVLVFDIITVDCVASGSQLTKLTSKVPCSFTVSAKIEYLGYFIECYAHITECSVCGYVSNYVLALKSVVNCNSYV